MTLGHGHIPCLMAVRRFLRSRSAMHPAQAVRTLNELITVTHDAERGFSACGVRARDPALRAYLRARARSCASAAEQLQKWVQRLGGEPARRGSRMGAVHRGWAGLRAALALDDDAAMLAECERGEGHALAIYRNALDDPLPEPVHQLVLQQFAGLMKSHDEIRLLHLAPTLVPAIAARPRGYDPAP